MVDVSTNNFFVVRGVATGGYIGIYTPKSVYLKFFMWLFCLLDPGQIEIAITS